MSSTLNKPKYADVLKDIDSFYTDHALEAVCPTSNTTLKVKPLSVSQLKGFIEMQVQTEKDDYGVIPGLNAVQQLNDIIVDNAVADNKDGILDTLTVVDRDAVLVQMRESVNNELELALEDEVVENVNLSDVVDRIKKVKFPAKQKVKTATLKFAGGNIKIKLALPSLQTDSIINNYFKSKISQKIQKGKKQIKKDIDKILGQVYLAEISKYIVSIVVTKGDNETFINFSDSSTLDDNLQLLEKLPSNVISEATKYIGDVKKYRDSVFYYINVDDKHVPLQIDLALFAGI